MPGLPDIPPGLETQANADLEAVAALIDAIQPAELAADGRYWQGLPSHAAPPANGNVVAPDRLTSKPTDRARSWSGVSLAPGSRRVSVRCDEYAGPSGLGYTVVGIIEVGGTVYERAISTGPETWRSHDWLEMVEAI